MKYCMNCGQQGRDQDKFCVNCGHPFPIALGGRAAVGQSYRPPTPPHAVRNGLIALTAALLAIVVMGAAFHLALSTPSSPAVGFGGLSIRGNRSTGYTASFFLVDSNWRVVPSDGNVTIVITEGVTMVLYRSSFHVTSSEFNVTNQTIVPFGTTYYSGPGYQWKIPASQVATCTDLPRCYFEPQAELSFMPPTGSNFTITLSGGFTV
jgi:hypothetical protein